MKNQVQQGDAINVVAPSGGFVAGNAYLIGASLFGVAAFSCAAGATGVLWRKGAYSLTKISAQAWVVGDIIYWSVNNAALTNVNASSDVKVGIAIATAANPTALGTCLLTGQC
jgi:predicted RecA/RadA family phage recombinase